MSGEDRGSADHGARPPSTRIRPAGASDLDDLVELERRCFARPWSRRLLAAELALASSRTWIALLDQRPVGFAIARSTGASAELLRIGVAPAHRRRSVARSLVGAMIDAFDRAAIPELLLEVREDNHAALGLYQGLGFRITGRRRRYYEDCTDALLLDLRLGSSTAAEPTAQRFRR
ncbi:MAG TPA: ribosomal protein S18-alanine N-acetyltransferase [Thermoanaerobaculia bacterium]|nr:ribosomal protein S18-alanine N-acetyltransferase [Thermoanaerobaculia bacterium]